VLCVGSESPTKSGIFQNWWGSENFKIMNLSIKDIENDISGYQTRISSARKKLTGLPEGYLPYHEHKKREKMRRELESDIKYYFQVVIYANEGLELLKKEKTTW